MKYKVGMRVWIDGEKFIIRNIGIYKPLSTYFAIDADSENDSNYSCMFFSDDDGVKPIITCK